MIRFEIPIETESVSNLREHWSKRARRVKSQRAATAAKMPRSVKELGPLIIVALMRVAPRQLDDDNLRGALKGVRDQIACALGIDDRSNLVRWRYYQAKGKPAVMVVVESAERDLGLSAAAMFTVPGVLPGPGPIEPGAIRPFDADDFNGRPRR